MLPTYLSCASIEWLHADKTLRLAHFLVYKFVFLADNLIFSKYILGQMGNLKKLVPSAPFVAPFPVLSNSFPKIILIHYCLEQVDFGGHLPAQASGLSNC